MCNWPSGMSGTNRRQPVGTGATSRSNIKDAVSLDWRSYMPDRLRPTHTSTSDSTPSLLWGSFNFVTATPIHDDARFSILNYCMNYYLPIQVHHPFGQNPIDQSYLISMSFHSPALMNALCACAALTLRSSSQPWQSFAIGCYILSLREVRQGIADGSYTGTEDFLLATIMWLCVFEVTPFCFAFCYDLLLIHLDLTT
jgi:hypothetical protein